MTGGYNNMCLRGSQTHVVSTEWKVAPAWQGGAIGQPGLDTHTATRLALKLHAHSVQYAYKLPSARRALEKTPLNSQCWHIHNSYTQS
eukprot:1155412-Pelagomonas_calceolata.AAC.6